MGGSNPEMDKHPVQTYEGSTVETRFNEVPRDWEN